MKNMYCFRNIFIAISLLSVFCKCTADKAEVEEYQSVKIDMNKVISNVNYHELFSKIEIVPLQTSDTSLIGRVQKFIITDDYYVVQDQQMIIFVYDKMGNFISNSSKQRGPGPEEYQIFIGMAYNEYTQCIDVITPYYLMSYNTSFQFERKTKLPTYAATDKHLSFFFEELFAIEKDKYIIVLPTTVSEDPRRVVLYDLKKGEIIKDVSYENDVIHGLNQQDQAMNNFDNQNLSFSPFALTYFLYTINLESFSLKKKYKLDFGNKSVTIKDLKGFQTERESLDYLAFESKAPLPLRNFFSQKYIVSIIRCSNEYYTFIKQIESNRDYLIKNEHSAEQTNIPIFDELKNDILYSILTPDELKNLDTTLCSDEDKMLLDNIKEDDNPVVVKYYLK
jgi:hypothetical protein